MLRHHKKNRMRVICNIPFNKAKSKTFSHSLENEYKNHPPQGG